MSPDEFEYGYRYHDVPPAQTVGPFRSKDTALRRAEEDNTRLPMRRPAGSTDPSEWTEVEE